MKAESTPFDQQLFLVFIVTFASMTAFELVVQFLFPFPPDWRLNLITILFVSGLAVIIAYYPLNSYFIKNVEVLTEIERRRSMETGLRESEEKYRELANNSPSMISLNRPGRAMTFRTRLPPHSLGYPRMNLPEAPRDIFPPPLAEHHLKGIRSILCQGATLIYEIKETFPTGERWIYARMTPCKNAEGTVIGVLGISNDITERKNAEDALRMAIKANLLSSITRHDINNMLMAQMTYLELLKECPSNPPYSEYFHTVTSLSEQIASTLQFAKEYESIGVDAPAGRTAARSLTKQQKKFHSGRSR